MLCHALAPWPPGQEGVSWAMVHRMGSLERDAGPSEPRMVHRMVAAGRGSHLHVCACRALHVFSKPAREDAVTKSSRMRKFEFGESQASEAADEESALQAGSASPCHHGHHQLGFTPDENRRFKRRLRSALQMWFGGPTPRSLSSALPQRQSLRLRNARPGPVRRCGGKVLLRCFRGLKRHFLPTGEALVLPGRLCAPRRCALPRPLPALDFVPDCVGGTSARWAEESGGGPDDGGKTCGSRQPGPLG